MERKNCWEVMGCGRERNGARVDELGVCAASLPSEHSGLNKGVEGGRICWFVAGSFCLGKPSAVGLATLASCFECPFLTQVHDEESRSFILIPGTEVTEVQEVARKR